jgi:hypothetical protein
MMIVCQKGIYLVTELVFLLEHLLDALLKFLLIVGIVGVEDHKSVLPPSFIHFRVTHAP